MTTAWDTHVRRSLDKKIGMLERYANAALAPASEKHTVPTPWETYCTACSIAGMPRTADQYVFNTATHFYQMAMIEHYRREPVVNELRLQGRQNAVLAETARVQAPRKRLIGSSRRKNRSVRLVWSCGGRRSSASRLKSAPQPNCMS